MNYKARVKDVLNRKGYYIYETTYTDRLKTIYVAKQNSHEVVKAFTDTTWQGISENISYNLAMFGGI